MCKCKGKCGCNISTITKGEKGDAGTAEVSFYSFKAQTITSPATVDIQTTVGADGDYVVQLEMGVRNLDVAAVYVTTSALKNGSLDSLNDNYERIENDIPVDKRLTYTHTVKLTGLTAGQTVGFQLASDGVFIANNGSLTIFKVA